MLGAREKKEQQLLTIVFQLLQEHTSIPEIPDNGGTTCATRGDVVLAWPVTLVSIQREEEMR